MHSPARPFFNYPVLTITQMEKKFPIPSILSLSKTALGAAQKFNGTLLRLGEPIYFNVFRITTELKKGRAGNAFIPVFSCVKQTTEEEREFCKLVYEKLQAMQGINNQ